MTKTAQNWLDTKYSDKTISEIKLDEKSGESVEELTGELLIKDYTKVEVIDFERWDKKTKDKITKVIIENCPQVKKIKFNNNEIGEITFQGTFNNLSWLDLPDNKLIKIDVSKFPNLSRLNVTRNPNLTEIEGWENFTKLEFFDLFDTPGLNGKKFKEWKDAINSALGGTSKDGSLPKDWNIKLDDLKNRPTQDDLKKAVKNESDKYKDYINPTDPGQKSKLEQAAKDAGFVTKEEYDKVVGERDARPNISLPDWTKTMDELNKVKGLLGINPAALLPNSWVNWLAKKADLITAKNTLKEWTDKFPGKTAQQVEQELKDLRSRPATGGSGTGLTPKQQQDLVNYENLKAQQKRLLEYLKEEKSNRQYAQIIQDLKITIT